MRVLPSLGLAVALLGCRHGSAPGPAPPARFTEVGLEVVNHHWGDVRIYAIHDGVAERVGMVTAVSTESFILPGRYFNSGGLIRLRAWPIGDPTFFTSEALQIQPGQMIIWTLETQLDRSSVMLRKRKRTTP